MTTDCRNNPSSNHCMMFDMFIKKSNSIDPNCFLFIYLFFVRKDDFKKQKKQKKKPLAESPGKLLKAAHVRRLPRGRESHSHCLPDRFISGSLWHSPAVICALQEFLQQH